MARMPEAEWIGPQHNNGYISRYDIVCIHTIVGNPPAHAAHFSVRSDGHVYQSRDTAYASAANLNGNYRIIAIENDDSGSEYGNWNTNDGHAVPAFTDAQCEAIAHVLVWCYRTHGIPLVACPDSKSSSKGIAYHRQGIKGNWEGYAYGGIISGGELWSNATGKVCPGDRRIKQVLEVIIPRARVLAGLEEEMGLTQDELNMLGDIQLRVASMHAGQFLPWPSPPGAPGGDLTWFQTQSAIALAPVNAMLSEILAQTSDDLSGEEIITRLNSHLDVEMVKIAEQHNAQITIITSQLEEIIRETLPEDLAEQVIDALAARLNRS